MAGESTFPAVLDPPLVGSYPAFAKAGGGFVWDAVLEYRVWCHPERGAPDEVEGGPALSRGPVRIFAVGSDYCRFAHSSPTSRA